MKRAICLNCLCAAFGFLCAEGRADVVTEWNSLTLDAIRNESTASPLATRNLAILHTAMFDAVNSIERTCEPYLFPQTTPAGASAEAAAVGAAYECLSNLYPSQGASFDAAMTRFLARTPATTNRADGLMVGETTALIFLVWRSADGSSTSVPYIPSSEPGQWRRTPPFNHSPEFPQWPYLTPFAMTNGAQFRPQAPPALGSTQYTSDFNLVKQVGSFASPSRTAEQYATARFWSDFSYTSTCAGHWNQIAQNVATNRPGTLAENARLFALLNIALADAGIAAWDAKYLYNFWRPVTAIQFAEADENADTTANTNWTPLLTTPYFPEYVSEHSIFSSTAAAVLASFYGTDQVLFSVGSDILFGIRSYDSFAAAAEENGQSRIYGGVNFPFSHLAGAEAGRKVGRYVAQNYLQPNPAPPRLTITVAPSAGRAQITVTATTAQSFILQISINLIDWTPIMTNAAPFTFEDAGQPSTTARFFRAIAAQ